MPILTSGKAILTASPSAATRPWQASAISNAPPMHTPLIAETHGLPQVSSLRKTPLMRPALSNSSLTAASGSLAFSALKRSNIVLSIEMSAR